MNSEQLRQFRWFWAWDDEKEEAWLREMANTGWHLEQAQLPGWYAFTQGAPRDDVYRLDFAPKKTAEYFQLFQDAGWQYIGEMGSWQYFRKGVVDGKVPEIFTDADSKVTKYQRIMVMLVGFSVIWSVFIRSLSKSASDHSGIEWIDVALWFFFAIYFFYFYAIIKLWKRIQMLKKL